MKIDHIVLGIRTRSEGIRELHEALGVEAAIGGSHPNWGTENALTRLADARVGECGRPDRCYLEILGLSAGGPSISTVKALEALPNLCPVAWALETSDLDRVEEVLEAEGIRDRVRIPGSRTRPDGVRLSWELLVVREEEMPTAPFFIRWGGGTPHPSESAPGGVLLERFAVIDPEPDRLRALLGALDSDVEVRWGSSRGFACSLSGPKGRMEWGLERDLEHEGHPSPTVRFA